MSSCSHNFCNLHGKHPFLVWPLHGCAGQDDILGLIKVEDPCRSLLRVTLLIENIFLGFSKRKLSFSTVLGQ